jgi:hypothetical protein
MRLAIDPSREAIAKKRCPSFLDENKKEAQVVTEGSDADASDRPSGRHTRDMIHRMLASTRAGSRRSRASRAPGDARTWAMGEAMPARRPRPTRPLRCRRESPPARAASASRDARVRRYVVRGAPLD